MRSLATLLCLFAATVPAQPLACECDHATKGAYDQRNCGLCNEVDKAPGTGPVVFVKDNSPLKPNRWLALPRRHPSARVELLSDLTQEERTALWREAIARANQEWGERWGLAMNGTLSRGQCHTHIHIGRLIDGVEWGEFKEINGPEEVPDPGLSGVWVHPAANGKLHAHVEMSTETVLAR
jgi:diadenosine tetraphosphate (Ap4A) HIT family hydrolase